MVTKKWWIETWKFVMKQVHNIIKIAGHRWVRLAQGLGRPIPNSGRSRAVNDDDYYYQLPTFITLFWASGILIQRISLADYVRSDPFAKNRESSLRSARNLSRVCLVFKNYRLDKKKTAKFSVVIKCKLLNKFTVY